ncbi:MAG: hypothetical protein AAB932_02760, partial [Patescibacteria group bacterium]
MRRGRETAYLSHIQNPELRREQHAQFEIERESIEEHREEAKRIIADQLTRDARILVLDVSQGGFDPNKVANKQLVNRVMETQYGKAGTTSHGEIMRRMLGFEPDDPRVTVWDVANDPDRTDIPYPDAWVGTGGPAMPSELDPGNETKNTKWLQRTADAMQELSRANVPGVAICLSHQLWEYGRGARVGKRHPQRQFGTARLRATEEGKRLQLLYGFWDDTGEVDISASHSEGVITPPPEGNFQVLAVDDYSDYQVAVHPLRKDQPIEEAIEE